MDDEGTRVMLLPAARRDRADFVAAMRASADLHQPWISPPLDDDAFDAVLARARGESFEFLLVRRRSDGAIAGYFDVSQIIRGPLQSAFLGYGGVAALSGQGYMSEGLRLLLRYVFVDLRLHRIEANIQPGNERSLALVRRAGFVREGFSERYLKIGGRWRDHERWAIRLEQWQDRNEREGYAPSQWSSESA
ncbi:MAG TPA: GNAT family N-acetyltransferase [Solirubrobacterales bacterium]|nr:GNAT family N-acetyltransferase [Solirubrobacterales bacterium]